MLFVANVSIAMKTGVASAYIATTMNVATTPYCHAWQQTAMVARNPNSCNAKLATVKIPYCDVTFCNHWQRTRFGCNIYLLQPNWAYCNVFSSLRKGLKGVSFSHAKNLQEGSSTYMQKGLEVSR